VHVNLTTINPGSCVRRALSIPPIYVPVMPPYSLKIFSGDLALENHPVSTL
jgi:hypothetical protein